MHASDRARAPAAVKLALIGFIAFAALAVGAEPIRILPIGDSITQGGRLGRPEYTYRWPLARLLKDDGYEVAFIGTRSGGLHDNFKWPEPWCDRHEGYYGATTRFVTDRVVAHLALLPPPDVALVNLGTNDNGWLSFDNVVTPLTRLVEALRERNPAVAVLVYQPTKRLLEGGGVLHVNLRAMAERLSTPDSTVTVVEDDVGADTFDGVHPDEAGQAHQAAQWMNALRPILRPSEAWSREPLAAPAAKEESAQASTDQCNTTYIEPTGKRNSTWASPRFSGTAATGMPFMSSAVARVSAGLRIDTSSSGFSTRQGASPIAFTSQPATVGPPLTAICAGT